MIRQTPYYSLLWRGAGGPVSDLTTLVTPRSYRRTFVRHDLPVQVGAGGVREGHTSRRSAEIYELNPVFVLQDMSRISPRLGQQMVASWAL